MIPPDKLQYTDATMRAAIMPQDNVPDHAHWVPSDLTEVAGDWFPRRPDWQDVIVKAKPASHGDLTKVLQEISVAPLREYALRPIPFGTWKPKPGCDFSNVRKVKDYAGAERPSWMDVMPVPPEDAPVYTITPGAAVFNNICINCHGPQADSKGLLAEAISELTGGDARVANFKDGLLGPAVDPGANITRVFGPVAAGIAGATPVTAEDLAARYMVWMALGGTQRQIPQSLLSLVSATAVMGQRRGKTFYTAGSSPNMLQVAEELCRQTLPYIIANGTGGVDFGKLFVEKGGKVNWEVTGLLARTGDAEMWLRLCSIGNRPIVRVPTVTFQGEGSARKVIKELNDYEGSLFYGDDYPPDHPVMNHLGQAVKWKDDHLMPFCVRAPASAADQELVKQDLRGAGGQPMPFCPEILFEPGPDGKPKRALLRSREPDAFPDANRWATRGAANAGIAVFLYLQELERGKLKPLPPFDRCEDDETMRVKK
jgi:mono/diheme cytochrome c family protein